MSKLAFLQLPNEWDNQGKLTAGTSYIFSMFRSSSSTGWETIRRPMPSVRRILEQDEPTEQNLAVLGYAGGDVRGLDHEGWL